MSLAPGRVAVALMLAVPAPLGAQDSLPDSGARASPVSLSAFTLQRLPIDDPRHALPLVPGVVLRAGEIGIDRRPLLVIRGGRNASANVYIDGAPVRFQTFGTAGIGLPLDAIAEAAVVTGVAPVTFGDAGGGAIVYRTRSGGTRWRGDVRWESDEPFGRSYTVGYNRIAAHAGGPISGGATVFFAAALQGQRSAYRGADAAEVPTYLPGAPDTTVLDGGGSPVTLPEFVQVSGDCAECDGLRRPLDWSTARRAVAKIELPYGRNSAVSITAFGAELQERQFPGQSALNPLLYAGRRAWSGAAIANWRHHVGDALVLSANASLVGHRDILGPLDPDVEADTRDPALGINFGRLRFLGEVVLDLPVDDALIRDIRTQTGSRGVAFYADPNEAVQAHRGNPYGLFAGGWSTRGIGGFLQDLSERRAQGRATIEWTTSPHHHMTLGVEVERSAVTGYSAGLLNGNLLDGFTATPAKLGFLAGNRFTIAEAVFDVGIRYDRFDPGGDLPNTPGFIASSQMPLWNVDAFTDDTAYANSVARVFHPARVQDVWSPRLQFRYPLSPSVILQVGYSRNADPPPWRELFLRANSDLSFTSTVGLFGRDVDFVVTSMIDAGIETRLRDGLALKVDVFRRGLGDYIGRIEQFSPPNDPTRTIGIGVITPFDNAHVLGVDAALVWEYGWVRATTAYSLARTHAEFDEPPAPTRGDITQHALAFAATLTSTAQTGPAEGTEATLLLRAQSGAPYRPLVFPSGAGTVVPSGTLAGTPSEALSTERLPFFTRLDLRLAKTVRVAGRPWEVYLDARNLLNARHLIGLFGETSGTVNTPHRIQTIGDPNAPSGEYAFLRDEAENAGALEPDGSTVNLTACPAWGSPVNCVALTRVERRFGDGDGFYTLAEQERAFNAYYDDFFGAWRFYGSGRTVRVGVRLGF